jgi:hypothetical protein
MTVFKREDLMKIGRIALAVAFASMPFAALADSASEVVTAETHADLASQAGDINMVHMHLHHTVNCLVGPGGKGFDAKELNPCANAGNGAIPDAKDQAKIKALTDAVAKAETGIAATDVTAAKTAASATAAMLKAK